MAQVEGGATALILDSAAALKAGLAAVLPDLAAMLDADRCQAFAWHAKSAEYVLVSACGGGERMIGQFSLPMGKGLVGQAAAREEPINVTAVSASDVYMPLPGKELIPPQSSLAAPCLQGGAVIAVLVVERLQGRPFDDVAEAKLLTLAQQWAASISTMVAREDWTQMCGSSRHIPLDSQFLGVAASPGVAIGRVVVRYRVDLAAVPDRRVHDIPATLEQFQQALLRTQKDVESMTERMQGRLPAEELSLLDVYRSILQSADLINEVREVIKQGQWAAGALRQVLMRHIAEFNAMDDEYLRERGADLRDLGQRVLHHLLQLNAHQSEFVKDSILVADEVTTSMMLAVPNDQLAGIISRRGAQNSHVAIMARALGIPAVLGVGRLPLAEIDGVEAVIDGYFGQAILAPSSQTHNEFTRYMAEEADISTRVNALTAVPAETIDGHGIDLMVNAGLSTDLARSLTVGADGIGLFRTEIPFMQRDRFPSEQEQMNLYRQVLQSFAPRPVVMRSLDVGGDKQLSYFPISEDNPFLGWRGIRISLDHPEILLLQFRAMLRASVGLDNLKVMFPMITHTAEVEAVVRLLRQAHQEVCAQHGDCRFPMVGAMLEVPSSVYQMTAMARHVDFFSIGSNDLIQYFLAVDRNNAQVASLYDGLHPAVLQLFQQAAVQAQALGKPIGVCGELASDPAAVLLLLAMGFNQLSVSSIPLPRVKWVVRSVTMARAREVLQEVLMLEDAEEVRAHVEPILEEFGLGGLIRAGH